MQEDVLIGFNTLIGYLDVLKFISLHSFLL